MAPRGATRRTTIHTRGTARRARPRDVSFPVVASSPYQTRSLFTKRLQVPGGQLQPDLLAGLQGRARGAPQVEVAGLHEHVEVVAAVDDLGDDGAYTVHPGFAARITMRLGPDGQRLPAPRRDGRGGRRFPMSVCTEPLFRHAGIRFVVPRNSATNLFAGRSYTSEGGPDCTMRASRITKILSLTVIASFWSWVTKTKVFPSLRCSLRKLVEIFALLLDQKLPLGLPVFAS